MKISQIVNTDRLSLSFEVFPPKNDDAFDTVRTAVQQIAALSPAFVSVTYGAGGGTSAYTLAIAQLIKEQYGVPSLAHLTCISSDKSTVAEQIEQIHAHGIQNILALRGDVPESRKGEDRSTWDFHYAVDLIAAIKQSGYDFCVGGACYPEIHPESASQKEDIEFLRQKVQAGCEFLTTQMVFDNNLLYNFLFKARSAGITVPILAGIMPITSKVQVERAIKLSGSFMPQRFRSLVDRFGDDPVAMKQAGIAYATDQIIDLYANGVTNVHVFTMNKPDVARQIMANLAGILGK